MRQNVIRRKYQKVSRIELMIVGRTVEKKEEKFKVESDLNILWRFKLLCQRKTVYCMCVKKQFYQFTATVNVIDKFIIFQSHSFRTTHTLNCVHQHGPTVHLT